MSFIKTFIDAEIASRRKFLLGGATFAGAATLGLGRPSKLWALENPTIAWSYRDRSNPYWSTVANGGEAFVASLGKGDRSMQHLINEGSSEKSLSDIKALISKSGGNLALACDANDAPNARPIVEAITKAGAFVSTMWNKTEDLHPWDFGDNYVSHMSWSDRAPASETARVLIEAIGGSGAIVGLGGIASNNPAIERQAGLMDELANHPDVELLDYQSADWDTQKAAEVMSSFLTRFGDEIKGVFCANDGMAYGAIEALRAEGLIGIVPVVGFDGNPQAVDLVAAGDMAATVFSNPYWGGGITAALAYHAAIGTFKPSEEPQEHREFYGPNVVITTAEAEAFKAEFITSTPEYDWTDFWSRSSGQIQYS